MPAPKPKQPVTASTPLKPAEWTFVIEYVNNGGNATQAYMFANPSVTYSSARSLAARLSAKVNIKNAIHRETNRARRKDGPTAERVVAEWGHLAFAHIGQVIDPRTQTLRKNIPPEVWRAISQMETVTTTVGSTTTTRTKVRMHPKGDSLDKVARHLGLYKDLPPLETILALLPPAVAAVLRQELARAVPPGGGDSGTGPGTDLPRLGGGPAGEGARGGAGGAEGSGDGVPGDEVGARPVADELPAGDLHPQPAPVLPAGGEVGDECGEDPGPLFDDP